MIISDMGHPFYMPDSYSVRSYLPPHHRWAYDQLHRIQQIATAADDAKTFERIEQLEAK